MNKKFDEISRNGQILLIRALMQKKDYMELIKYEQGKPFDIKFTVNGVEFDFEEVVRDTIDMLNKDLDNRAAKLLDEKICNIFAIDELQETLRRTRNEVRDRVEQLLNITIERDFY